MQESPDLQAYPLAGFLVQIIVRAEFDPSLVRHGVEGRIGEDTPDVVFIQLILHQGVEELQTVHRLGDDARFTTSCGRKLLMALGYTSQIQVEYKMGTESSKQTHAMKLYLQVRHLVVV